MLFPLRDSIPSRVAPLVFLGIFVTTAELPALVFLVFWFVLQFVQGTLSVAAGSGAGGVAWFAHVGGFVFGVVVAWLLGGRRRRSPVPDLS